MPHAAALHLGYSRIMTNERMDTPSFFLFVAGLVGFLACTGMVGIIRMLTGPGWLGFTVDQAAHANALVLFGAALAGGLGLRASGLRLRRPGWLAILGGLAALAWFASLPVAKGALLLLGA
jgi:hypothetical protein